MEFIDQKVIHAAVLQLSSGHVPRMRLLWRRDVIEHRTSRSAQSWMAFVRLVLERASSYTVRLPPRGPSPYNAVPRQSCGETVGDKVTD